MGGCCGTKAVLTSENSDPDGSKKSCRTPIRAKVFKKKLKEQDEAMLAAYSYIETSGEDDSGSKLMQMRPNYAVLGLLDKIFDYLEFEDLETVAQCCKLFCYVVTLDRLLEKYHHSILGSNKSLLLKEEGAEKDLDETLGNQETRKESADIRFDLVNVQSSDQE